MSFSIKKTLMIIIIIILASYSLIILSLYFLRNIPENFESAGDYPMSVDNPLLYGHYNVKKHIELSHDNSSDIYENYPIFSSNSKYNNNVRDWRRPTNGTCSRAELCDFVYDNTEQQLASEPELLRWDMLPRVNYYKSAY